MKKNLFEIETVYGEIIEFCTVQEVINYYKNNIENVCIIYKNLQNKQVIVAETNEFYLMIYEDKRVILDNKDNLKSLEYYLVWTI